MYSIQNNGYFFEQSEHYRFHLKLGLLLYQSAEIIILSARVKMFGIAACYRSYSRSTSR